MPTTQTQMVDLRGQYRAIKDEIDAALAGVLDSTSFIRGPEVQTFEQELAQYLGGAHAIGVANGTDALQIAMMALGVGAGDEVITTAFTFIATAEAAALLGARAVFVDIDPRTFNLDPEHIEAAITSRTKAIVPVHLFGQSAGMDPILETAARHGLAVVEDNAQGIGARYEGRPTGFMGDLGTLSFFPSKNLGCFGDGGAVLTNDDELAERVRMISNHGSRRKYHNEVVGVNSRLDTLQAAVLRVKLRHLERYTSARQDAASRYDDLLGSVEGVTIPYRDPRSSHVFHQYTIRVTPEVDRDRLAQHLSDQSIPSMVYYPVPLHQLPVFAEQEHGSLLETERAAAEVLSLPLHTELTEQEQTAIAAAIQSFIHG